MVALLGVVTAKSTVNKKDKKKANSDDLRPDAIKALGAIGPDAKEAVPVLSDIATAKKGKDKALKQAAADALVGLPGGMLRDGASGGGVPTLRAPSGGGGGGIGAEPRFGGGAGGGAAREPPAGGSGGGGAGG